MSCWVPLVKGLAAGASAAPAPVPCVPCAPDRTSQVTVTNRLKGENGDSLVLGPLIPDGEAFFS